MEQILVYCVSISLKGMPQEEIDGKYHHLQMLKLYLWSEEMLSQLLSGYCTNIEILP